MNLIINIIQEMYLQLKQKSTFSELIHFLEDYNRYRVVIFRVN